MSIGSYPEQRTWAFQWPLWGRWKRQLHHWAQLFLLLRSWAVFPLCRQAATLANIHPPLHVECNCPSNPRVGLVVLIDPFQLRISDSMILIAVMGWCQCSITAFMTLLRGAQQQDKSHTLEQGKWGFAVNVIRHWRKLPREDVESPSLEILKNGRDPEQPNLALHYAEGWTLDLLGMTPLGHPKWFCFLTCRFSLLKSLLLHELENKKSALPAVPICPFPFLVKLLHVCRCQKRCSHWVYKTQTLGSVTHIAGEFKGTILCLLLPFLIPSSTKMKAMPVPELPYLRPAFWKSTAWRFWLHAERCIVH